MLLTYFFRVVTLTIALAGLAYLGYYVCVSIPIVDPETVVCITIPDMLFFYLAYKTYPEQEPVMRHRHGF